MCKSYCLLITLLTHLSLSACYVVVHQQPFIVDAYKAGSPVLFIPGDGGTHMEARLNKTSIVHYLCAKTSTDYFNVWLNLELLVPLVLDCWVDNVRLTYDNVTRKSSNSPGVEIRIPDFGNTSSVEWLDPSKASQGAYFKDIAEVLIPLGYERGVSMFGAPYDFRKAPNELQDFFVNLTKLIEDGYEKNGGRPVVLVAHSMGGPTMLYYLNNQKQSWKNKYIGSLITLAGVWGGAVKAMKVFASGDNLGIYVLSAWTLRGQQMTAPSLAFLLPSDKFWSKDDILVSTSTRNYTVADYKDYFQDLKFTDGYNMWLDTKNLIYDLQPPGVEVHCLYGTGVDTEEKITYSTIPSNSPTIKYGSGDGTVNLRSLEGCLRWKGKQKQPVYSQAFDRVNHMDIIRHPDVLEYIRKVVSAPTWN
ncbi:hypothetical protein CHUAL_013532 [Chamberlinius hualienensis]